MSLKTRKISSLIYFIFCFATAIAFMVISAQKGVKSLNEITEVEASIEYISPKNYRNSISYDLKLNGFDNLFKISADYENLFDYSSLIKNVTTADKLLIAISKEDLENLSRTRKVNVLGVRTQNEVYLDKAKVLEKDMKIRKYIYSIGGTVLILLSIGVYIYRRLFYEYDF